MLVPSDAQVAERPLVLVLQPGAADHLRADEPGPVPAALAAECLDADPGHGGQDEAGRDLDLPDPPRLAKIYLHRAENGSCEAC